MKRVLMMAVALIISIAFMSPVMTPEKVTAAESMDKTEKESVGKYVDDSVITTKIKALLAQDDILKAFQISVETYKGTVQLSGFVNSQQTVDKAGEITRNVQGVKSVKNNLIVK